MSTLMPVNQAIEGLRLDFWLMHLKSSTGSLLQTIMAPKLKAVSTVMKISEHIGNPKIKGKIRAWCAGWTYGGVGHLKS